VLNDAFSFAIMNGCRQLIICLANIPDIPLHAVFVFNRPVPLINDEQE
jgi:hypothetical protein